MLFFGRQMISQHRDRRAQFADRTRRKPLVQVAMVPDTNERNPSFATSSRRSGIIAEIPPTMMPTLPKLAKPHSA